MRRLLLLAALLLALPGAAQAQNRFWAVNNSGETIRELYVSSSRVQDWGPDVLGAAVLAPGQRVFVTPNFGDCVMDVRAVYANGQAETRMQVNACSLSTIAFGGGAGAIIAPPGAGAGATVTPAPRPGAAVLASGNPSFNFLNRSGEQINEIYASLSSQGSWGTDRLGANVLAPGGSLPIALPLGGGCLTDLRVIYASGRSVERRGVETCSINGLDWR